MNLLFGFFKGWFDGFETESNVEFCKKKWTKWKITRNKPSQLRFEPRVYNHIRSTVVSNNFISLRLKIQRNWRTLNDFLALSGLSIKGKTSVCSCRINQIPLKRLKPSFPSFLNQILEVWSNYQFLNVKILL